MPFLGLQAATQKNMLTMYNNSAVNKDTSKLLVDTHQSMHAISEVQQEQTAKFSDALKLNYQYFSFTSTELGREESKEKESCEKSASASEDSKFG